AAIAVRAAARILDLAAEIVALAALT
nr:hypothetical protein [Tanacetum cinerariifolium]